MLVCLQGKPRFTPWYGTILKNQSAMRTWGLMLNFIPFHWNAVLKYQDMGVDLLQVKR